MTATRTLRIGTRASALARAQTRHVADAIGGPVELVPIVTHGDRSRAALTQIGGTGVFVSALRDALLAGEIDVAVHSYKDLPTSGSAPGDAAAGITVAAVPRREDPRDALVARDGRTLAELPPGARVGTGSPRRAAQLHALGLGLSVVEIRGNVDTRLGKVASGELDAVVLALAGLRRLGRDGAVSEILDPLQLLPAPAQGALAVECRSGDEGVRAVLAALDHADTRAAVTAERAVLAALQAGCSAPVGALAVVAEGERGTSAEGERGPSAEGERGPSAEGEHRPSAEGGPGAELFLRAIVSAPDGSDRVRHSATGRPGAAEAVGRRVAAALLADGAARMMATATPGGPEGWAGTPAHDSSSTTARSSSGEEGRAATQFRGPDWEASS